MTTTPPAARVRKEYDRAYRNVWWRKLWNDIFTLWSIKTRFNIFMRDVLKRIPFAAIFIFVWGGK